MLNRLLLLAGLAVLLSACGGSSPAGGGIPPGGGGTTGTQQGEFLDSAVQGLRFITQSQSGTTDNNGRFNYRTGETISFYVGDILLGSAPAKDTMTPVDLVAGAIDETHPHSHQHPAFFANAG